MKMLRVSCLLTGMLVFGASTASAQTSRISCKDGTRPKIGHFSCWGHGGLVREEAKAVITPVAKPASRVATTEKRPDKATKATTTKGTKATKATATKTTKLTKATKPKAKAKAKKPRPKLIAAQHTAK